VLATETADLDVDALPAAELVARSPRVMGNGRIDDLCDVVVVDMQRFDRAHSRDAAEEVARYNAELREAGRPYVLVGVGRWGSTDPWLGIPVQWNQISGARVIVESGFRDFLVTPSQGSHFFQNLWSFQVGYFTVNEDVGEGFVDWAWLAEAPAVSELTYTRHLRFEQPLVVMMNGRLTAGVICKPGYAPQ